MVLPYPAILLMETLLARLLCEFKMLGGLHGNAVNWSSGMVTVDHRSPDNEGDVDDTDDADEVAVYEHQRTQLGLSILTIYSDA